MEKDNNKTRSTDPVSLPTRPKTTGQTGASQTLRNSTGLSTEFRLNPNNQPGSGEAAQTVRNNDRRHSPANSVQTQASQASRNTMSSTVAAASTSPHRPSGDEDIELGPNPEHQRARDIAKKLEEFKKPFDDDNSDDTINHRLRN